jgi:hypothetical protein
MATPHVTGAAAMLGALCPDWTHKEIRSHILATVASTSSLEVKTVTGGRLNLGRATANASCGPAPPSDDPPTVEITSPTNNATVSGSVTVTANAVDDETITKVEFFVGGVFIKEVKIIPYAIAWDTDRYDDGTYSLSAVATDDAGQTGSDSVNVTVQNVPPVTQEMHIGDLEGAAQTVNKRFWRASVTIAVLDKAGSGVSGATVTGNWTGGYEGTSTCTTDASGTCGVTSGNIRVGTSSVTFNVNGVTADGYEWDSIADPLEVTSP